MTDDDRLDRLAKRVEHVVEQVSELRAETRVQNADLRAEMIDREGNHPKWLLGFFVAQTAALAALLAAFH